MKEGTIKDCRFRNGSAELRIFVDGKEQRFTIPIAQENMIYFKAKTKCQLEISKDKIVTLRVGDKVMYDDGGKNYPPPTPSAKPNDKPQAKGNPKPDMDNASYAKAPYNFVPVNDKVVSVPKPVDFDRYNQESFSGYIDLNIETLTPIYIRDAYNPEDPKDAKQASDAEKSGDKWENPDFFSPAGTPRIPGSSLRGMVRNLVEIVSYSRIEYVDDTTLYYRSLADQCRSIRTEYQNNMGQRDIKNNKTIYKFNAGYLERSGKNYQIRPAQIINGRQYFRTNIKYHPDFSWHWQSDGSCITVSGPAPNKKSKDWQINQVDKSAKPIMITKRDLASYRDDINRFKDKRKVTDAEKRDGDLLRCLGVEENNSEGKRMVPCFYVVWKDREGTERVSFGHTAYFRLAYRLSVKQHLPSEHQVQKGEIDISNSIFGMGSNFAGRVFFEDAKHSGARHNMDSEQEYYPKVLSGPKPTTFQHYIEQGNRDKNNLLHWNKTEGLIRGYKLYWHRITPQYGINGWAETEENANKHKSQYTTIKPIKEKSVFNGRIRFENLSDIELGALLFVLQLPEGCAHKIGMGKPLGLGSIRIQPVLTFIQRKDKTDDSRGRYGKLFEEKQWYLGESKKSEDELVELKRAFSTFILKETNQETASTDPYVSLWKTERLKELKAMLDYTNTARAKDWLDRTRYMEIERKINDSGKKENEFKERPVLKPPTFIMQLAGVKHE